uniref:Solute carrier family 12 member 3 n=1 Tax=Plectus sambesii TaxID=2011161 RepID=A0A914WXK5_9BILA
MALTDQEKSFLPAEGEGAPLDGSGMNRSSSSRFHVENIVEPNSVELNNTNPRKPSDSSNGRFQVAPHDPPSNNPAGKAVHFSVGDEHKPHRQDSSSTIENNTINHKSFRNVQTLEKPPIIDFYLNSSDADGGMVTRPSMIALLTGRPNEVVTLELDEFKSQNDEIFDGQGLAESRLEKFKPPPSSAARVKFGWIEGVFVRCLLNILGVMLYLRISWVAGQAGLILGSAIVLLASTVTTITAISMCAICTNGDVKGGGAYFLISRYFGGSIGLIFSVANAVGAAMYVVGFAETVRDLMVEQGWKIIDNDVMDVRIIGLVTCTLLMAIVFIGTSFESRMQIGLLAILTVSIVNYWVGTFIPIKEVKRGVTGYSFTTMMTNMLPAFRGEDFFSVFAVYFPAATGIMAGANISGDLADPQKSIPKGTLWAILGTTLLYLSTVWLTGSTCVRDAMEYGAPLLANGTWEWLSPPCALNHTCTYGLLNYFQVMKIESGWGPLITAGIFAATLSSALASLVSAPKVFQAVCKDRLFPYIHFFAKGYGKDEEPRRAYALGFAIAMLMILIGDLNAIAPIISNFFLASYALINYACFDASFADSPGMTLYFCF